jgi:hypothetical protein
MSHRLARAATLSSAAFLIALATTGTSASAFAQSGAQGAQQAASVSIPGTPAGQVLKAWLEAFNSGDSARLNAYYQRHQPERPANAEVNFRNSTGGFDLLSIERSDPLHVEYTVKERKSPTTAFGIFDVAAGDPPHVTSASILAMPAGTTAAAFKIDAAERTRVVDGAAAELNRYYVFPDVASKMADTMRAHLKAGDYDATTNGLAFATLLTNQLQGVSHDRHLRVNFSPAPLAERNAGGPPPGAADRYRRQMESINCGFVKVEQLPGNVGYLKFNLFADPAVCGPTATAAMSFLANSDAMIIDLRDNGGGDPRMVAFLCSYFFTKRTHVNDLWNRETGATEEFWTTDSVPGKRFGDTKPVYLLTSKRTFSGAEEFSYNLKTQKRATIIGETTGGGAHPVSGRRIDEHFMIGVPGARAINPITKTNWEGVGVEPEVKVPAADALTTAQKMIAEKVPVRS